MARGDEVVPGAVAAIIIAVCISVAGLSFGIRACTAPVEGTVGAIERTFDADNIIYNYEYFQRAAAMIRAYDTQIVSSTAAANDFDSSLPSDHVQWDRDDKQESARLHTIAVGVRNERARAVAEYNARARMANRNIFRTDDPVTPPYIQE